MIMIKNRKKNRMKVRWKKKWMYVKYFAYLHDEVIYNTRLAKKKKRKIDWNYVTNCITTILKYQILNSLNHILKTSGEYIRWVQFICTQIYTDYQSEI